MTRFMVLFGVALCLAVAGCGSGDDPVAATKEAASEAGEMAGEVGDTARDALGDVSAGGGSDSIAQCLDLAARQAWNEALDPCTAAAKQKPDDLRIRHAVQQARAAAGQ